jgi:hypothetical protein
VSDVPSREAFLHWWPVAARIIGLVGGLAAGAYAIITGNRADPAFLSWCAGLLLVAPAVADGWAQRAPREPR